MSFRKRNVTLGKQESSQAVRPPNNRASGTRPSPLDGKPTTSSGTLSVDQLLAGHGGIPLGSSLLIEEVGTTDFGGILLRYYAAEGLVQGHHVHILGDAESWRRDLPGLSSVDKSRNSKLGKVTGEDDRMKIAWRYEALTNRQTHTRGGASHEKAEQSNSSFCHSFDLSKRLESHAVCGSLLAVSSEDKDGPYVRSQFDEFLARVTEDIDRSPSSIIHRMLVPSLLSPTFYSSRACQPQLVLKFLHDLRGVLRRFPTQATAMITLPISLFPRSSGLSRWAELLSDSVFELIPLQRRTQHVAGRDATAKDDKIQGLLKVHSLPVFHEKGGGQEGSWSREDMSFKLSSSQGLIITPYSLPPVGDDDAAVNQAAKNDATKQESLDF